MQTGLTPTSCTFWGKKTVSYIAFVDAVVSWVVEVRKNYIVIDYLSEN